MIILRYLTHTAISCSSHLQGQPENLQPCHQPLPTHNGGRQKHRMTLCSPHSSTGPHIGTWTGARCPLAVIGRHALPSAFASPATAPQSISNDGTPTALTDLITPSTHAKSHATAYLAQMHATLHHLGPQKTSSLIAGLAMVATPASSPSTGPPDRKDDNPGYPQPSRQPHLPGICGWTTQ